MKKIIIYIMAFCCLNFTSCSFLDESSQDEVRPSSVDDLIQLMLGDGYLMGDDFLSFFEHFSDDVASEYQVPEFPAGVNSLDQHKAMFLWDERMYDLCKEKGVRGYDHWEFIYRKIMGCNVVLSMIDKVTGLHNQKECLRGEALAMRAFYYFTLVNIYSMPYTSGDPDQLAGVPVLTEPQLEDSYPPRETVSAVYAQIISDLITAQPLLEKYAKTNVIYKVTDKFAPALLARVYLYMGDWAKSIEYSSLIIEKYPSLQKLSNYIELVEDEYFPEFYPPTIQPNYQYNVYSDKSAEVIWAYGKSGSSSILFIPASTFPPCGPVWAASDNLNALFKNDVSGAEDCRTKFYNVEYLKDFSTFTFGILYMDKGNRSRSASQGIRTAEMYLNRAEANIMLAIEGKGGDLSQALSDINTLRESRFETKEGTYTPITITDPEKLLAFYRDERRRELAFERHRWFDLRRWGILGFSHTIEQIQGQKETVVFDNPKKYALPIPQEVLDLNPSIRQNLYK